MEIPLHFEKTSKDLPRDLKACYRKNHDHCINCGRIFCDGETVHIGYAAEKPMVLCDQCSYMLSECVSNEKWFPPLFEKPDPSDVLWRYMDLGKFISILCTEKLYFAPLCGMDDPFEGAKGTIDNKFEWDEFYKEELGLIVEKEFGAEATLNDEQEKQFLDWLHEAGEIDRKSVCVSCWHRNDLESEAMWKLYSMNVTNAIAIRTTAQNLYEGLYENPYVDIGKIQYDDYQNKILGVNGAYWHKRKSFEYEQEVRAVIRNSEYDEYPGGMQVDVDLEKLIQAIYISPYAPKWFEDVVCDVVKRYGLNKPILHSIIGEKPFY